MNVQDNFSEQVKRTNDEDLSVVASLATEKNWSSSKETMEAIVLAKQSARGISRKGGRKVRGKEREGGS